MKPHGIAGLYYLISKEWLDVKRIVIKSAIFILLIILLDFSIGKLIVYLMNHHKLDTLSGIEYARYVNPEIIVVGASQAQAGYNSELISNFTGMKTINIGGASVSSSYIYIILKEILKTQKPKYIIYDASIVDIMGVANKSSTKRLAYLYGKDKEVDSILTQVIPNCKVTLLSSIFKYRMLIKNRLKFSNSINRDRYTYFEPDNGKTVDILVAEALTKNDTLSQKPLRSDTKSLTYRCFNKIITLCHKQKVELIIVLSPTYHKDIYKNNDYQYSSYIQNLESIKTLNFYNISPRRYTYFTNKIYFKDLNHLNGIGSDSLSIIIARSISNMELQKRTKDYKEIIKSN